MPMQCPQFDIELFNYRGNICMEITLHCIDLSNTAILCISIIEKTENCSFVHDT